MTTIRHTEFRKYDKPIPKWQLVHIMGYMSYSPKMYILYVSTYHEEIHYCRAYKYSTEQVCGAGTQISGSGSGHLIFLAPAPAIAGLKGRAARGKFHSRAPMTYFMTSSFVKFMFSLIRNVLFRFIQWSIMCLPY